MKVRKIMSCLLATTVISTMVCIAGAEQQQIVQKNATTSVFGNNYAPNMIAPFSPDNVPDEAYLAISDELDELLAEKEADYQLRKLRRDTIPATVNLNLAWSQQQNLYYCGPATARMVLWHFMYPPTQDEIAGLRYLRTNSVEGTAWYSGDGTNHSTYYFNMAYGLNMWQYDELGRYHFVYSAWHNDTKDEYINRILDTLANGYAIPLHGSGEGEDRGDYSDFESPYLRLHDGHWLALEGYSGSGTIFKVVDPASELEGTRFEGIPHKYNASVADIRYYIDYGVIW